MTSETVPVLAPAELVEGMCMTFRHDFGLVRPDGEPRMPGSGMSEAEREALRRTMRQLWDHDIRPYIVQALAEGRPLTGGLPATA